MSDESLLPRMWTLLQRRGEERVAETIPKLKVRADFESGSIGGFQAVSASHLRFIARADSSPRPLWFYFCIEDARVPAIRCDLVNADRCLGPRHGWATARPAFSPDREHWERVTRASYVEETQDSGYFTFTVPVVGPRTYVAYCYPYTTSDLRHLIQPLRGGDGARDGALCLSTENRPVPYLRFGNHDAPARSVWVIARQHAGETPASFAAEGMIRSLAEDRSLTPLLADTAFHVVPMVDVDGVYHGRYGKDQEPVDYNRDWRTHPIRPEIAALVKAIRASHERHPVSLVLDLHASHHGDTSCYLFAYGRQQGEDGEAGEELLRKQGGLIRRLAAEAPVSVGFRETDVRTEHLPPRSAREYLRRTFQIPVVTLELSYHLAQSGEYLTPAYYRAFGGALARAIAGYSRDPDAA
jgi:hypothetical protein